MDILQMTAIREREATMEYAKWVDEESRKLKAERERLLAEKERIAESRRQNKIDLERLLAESERLDREIEQIAEQKTRNKPFMNNLRQYEADKEEVKDRTEKEKISAYRKELRKKYLVKIEARIGNKNKRKYTHISSHNRIRIKKATNNINYNESIKDNCKEISEHNFYEFEMNKKSFTNQLETIESSKKAKQEEKIKTETKKDDKDFK